MKKLTVEQEGILEDIKNNSLKELADMFSDMDYSEFVEAAFVSRIKKALEEKCSLLKSKIKDENGWVGFDNKDIYAEIPVAALSLNLAKVFDSESNITAIIDRKRKMANMQKSILKMAVDADKINNNFVKMTQGTIFKDVVKKLSVIVGSIKQKVNSFENDRNQVFDKDKVKEVKELKKELKNECDKINKIFEKREAQRKAEEEFLKSYGIDIEENNNDNVIEFPSNNDNKIEFEKKDDGKSL